MADVQAIMEGISARASNIQGIRSTTRMSEAPNPPQFFLSWPIINRNLTYENGVETLGFEAVLVIARADSRTTFENMTKYFKDDANNIIIALEDPDTTPINVSYLLVESVEFSDISIGAIDYDSAILKMKVVI